MPLVGVLSADCMRVLNRVQNAVCAWGFLSANMIIIIMHCSCMMIRVRNYRPELDALVVSFICPHIHDTRV